MKLHRYLLPLAMVTTSAWAQYYPGAFGINATTNPNKPFPIATTISKLKNLKIKTVRLWLSINDWATPSKAFSSDSLNAIRKYKPMGGFDVLVVLSPQDGAVPANDTQVKNMIDYLMSQPGIKGNVDRWEIGNEVDSSGYWKGGSIASYVTKFLKPAAIALHSYGQKVVSAGPSWNVQDVQRMVDAGALNYVDAVGFHMYVHNVNDIEPNFAKINKMAPGFPIAITEWTVRGHEKANPAGGWMVGDANAWANDNARAYPLIAKHAKWAYFFKDYVTNQMAGCFSILKTDGTANEPSYSAFMDQLALYKSSNVPPDDDDVDPPTDPQQPENPQNPVQPGVTGISLVDGDLNQVVRGFEALGSKVVIDVNAVRVKNVNFSALVNNQTQSVKLTWDGMTRTESAAPFTAFESDAQGNYGGRAIVLGTHTLTAVPYAVSSGSGIAGTPVSIEVTFVDTAIPAITGFSVYDADTQKVIPGFENVNGSATLSLSATGVKHFAVTASLNDISQSVSLSSNLDTHVESHAPFAFYYDDNPKLRGVTPVAGTYTYSAFAFTLPSGTGTQGGSSTFKLTITK